MKKMVCVLFICCIMASIIACGESPTTPTDNSEASIVNTTESTTETTVTAPPETDTETIAEEYSEIMTGVEILTIEGHPTFYGSTEKAHEIWDSYAGEDTVVLKEAVGSHHTHDDAVLVLDCYESEGAYRKTNSEMINGVSIRFYNLSEDVIISFEDALEIVEEYMPIAVLKEKYKLFESCYQNVGTDDEPLYKYFINYKLNDELVSSANSEENPYAIWVSIYLYIDTDGNARSVSISGSRTSDSRSEPEKIEWGYDFVTE